MRLFAANILPPDWKVTSIEKLCERVTSGGTPSRRQSSYYNGDIPWVKTQELRDCWIVDTEEHLTEVGLRNSSAKILPQHTILMAMYGATVGRLGILIKPMTCNQAACAMIVDANVADYRYVYYQLLLARPQIFDLANGAAQQNLSGATIKSLELPLPPLPEQLGISATLGAIDDKIESNRRVAELSFELAQCLYVEASASASKLPLMSVGSVVLGGTPDRKNKTFWSNGTVAWINSGAANQDVILEASELITVEGLARSAAKMMPAGATVIAITGATLGQVSLLGIPTSGNQSVVGVWAEDENLTSWLHFAIRAAIPELIGSATGAAQQHVNKKNVEELLVTVPDARTLSLWATLAIPLITKSVTSLKENLALRSLRDTLLPELLSGRIRVPEAFEVVREGVA